MPGTPSNHLSSHLIKLWHVLYFSSPSNQLSSHLIKSWHVLYFIDLYSSHQVAIKIK